MSDDRINTRWWAMGATALTLLVVGLDMTILNVALPDIAIALHASNAQLQWFADAYLLVLAAVMLPAGMLGDRFGRKGLTLGALSVFGIGSAWCALATTAGSLIAGRVVLGFGAAVLIPLAMSAVVVLFEPPERPKAVLVLGLSTMVGLPLGPIAGGLLLQHFWWGSVFIVNVPVVVFALVAIARFMPAGRVAGTGDRLDLAGAAAAGAGLLGITYGVIEAPSRGWGDPVVLAALLGGLVVLAGFLVWEHRLTDAVPVFDVAIWDNRSFRWGAIAAAVASLAFFAVMFTMPQYFQAVLGADALGTGLRTLPMVAGMLVAMRGASVLASRLSGRALAALGFAATAVGLAVGATTEVSDGFVRSAIWTAVVGLGFGTALFAAQNTALLNLPRHRAASGSALIQTLRQVGSVLGIAVLGALLNDAYRSTVDTAGLPDHLAHAARESAQSGLAVAHTTGSARLADSVTAAFVHGMDVALWASAGVAVLGAVVVLAFMQPAQEGEPRQVAVPDAAESEDADVSPPPDGPAARTP
jgi:MFS transporter, DHA2 family, multidrug resistance protein